MFPISRLAPAAIATKINGYTQSLLTLNLTQQFLGWAF